MNGAHFATGAAVQFGSATLTTTRVSSTKLTATGTATSVQVGNVSVMVKNPDPGTVNSAVVTAKVTGASGISVSLTPPTATTRPGVNMTFAATVTGTTNQAVTWSMDNVAFGTPTIGFMNTQR